MKKILLLLLITSSAFSQEKKFFISIGSGASIPVGDFGTPVELYKFNQPNPNQGRGYATTGYYFNVDLGYFFSKHLGVLGDFQYMNNGVDGNSIINIAATSWDGIKHYNPRATTNWLNYGSFIGIAFKGNMSSRILIVAKAEVGLNGVVQPAMDYEDDYSHYRFIQQTDVQHNAIAYKGGASVSYTIFKALFVSAEANYLFVPASDYIVEKTGYVTTTHTSQRVNCIMLGVKVGIQL